MSRRPSFRRVWYATTDIRYRRQTTLLKRKVDRANPTAKACQAGIAWNSAVWAAFGDEIWRWTEGATWDAAREYLLPGGAFPRDHPCVWGTMLLWPLGDRGIAVTDGVSWLTTAATGSDAVALMVMGDVLWGIGSDGWVRRWTAQPTLASLGALDTWATGGEEVVRIDEPCSDIFVYFDGSGAAMPVITGRSRLYAVDVELRTATPTGPALAPHRFPLTAEVLGADNNVYMAQGLSVIQWTGDVATPVGLDQDDGLPINRRGGIVALANGTGSLFALVDGATEQPASDELVLWGGTDSGMADQFPQVLGLSALYSREGNSWVVRAVSDDPTLRATTLWLADLGTSWRVWFAWGTKIYTIDLEFGVVNPLDEPVGEFEAAGTIEWPLVDFGYKAEQKIAVMVQANVARCSPTETVAFELTYDQGQSWLPLLDRDGEAQITTNRVQTYWLSATGAAGPGPYDNPAVGRAFDTIGLRAHLRRGADITKTPAVLWATIHAIKVVPPLLGWTLTVDMSREVGTLTPWMQVLTLRRLLQANSRALLHFAYRPDEGRLANVCSSEDHGRVGPRVYRACRTLHGARQAVVDPGDDPTAQRADSGALSGYERAAAGGWTVTDLDVSPDLPKLPRLPRTARGIARIQPPSLGRARLGLPVLTEGEQPARAYPPVPDSFDGTTEEWAVYWAHQVLGRGDEGRALGL